MNNICSVNVNSVGDIICRLGDILNMVIPLLVALGVVIFVWGVVLYVIGSDEEAKGKGKERMMWGIIGFAVILGLWGLVAVILNTFGFSPGEGAYLPKQFIEANQNIIDGSTGSCGLPSKSKFGDILIYGTCIINKAVIPLIFALAVVLFIWGVVMYVINGDDESKKTKGKDFMLWGIVAIAIMGSVWGIVRILGDTFDIKYAIPQVDEQ